MKLKGRTGPAWKKRVASSVRLSQERRGFGLGDSKRCSPGSDDADEPRLGQSGDREALWRQLPIQRSATPFCQGLAGLMRVGLMPLAVSRSVTSPPNLASPSRIA